MNREIRCLIFSAAKALLCRVYRQIKFICINIFLVGRTVDFR